MNKQHGNAAVFYQNKEMQTLYNPFKIIYTNDTITHVQFKATDAMWSRNFKRSIAAALQLKGLKNGAYVEEEVRLLSYRLSLKKKNIIHDSLFIFFSLVYMVYAQRSIMSRQNRMVIYRFEKIQFCIHAYRTIVAFIRIDRMCQKINVLTVNPKRMLSLAMKLCTI